MTDQRLGEDAVGTAVRRDRSTLVNALIGGVVGIVLGFIPLSPALGGAVAGYLEGGDAWAGARVGALAGVVALVPFALVFALFVLITPFALSSGLGIPAAFWLLFLIALLSLVVYTVGLSALGGAIGAILRQETDL